MEEGDSQPQHGEQQPPSATTSTASSVAKSSAKRRRGVGLVTPNACMECRKKRSKCDGRLPCGRCQANGVECVYHQPQRTSKDNLRHEIEELRRQQQTNEHVLSTLVRRPELTEEVLARLRDGENVDAISASLASSGHSGEREVFDGRTRGKAPVGAMHEGDGDGRSRRPLGLGTASPAPNMQSGARFETDHLSPWGSGFSFAHSQISSRSDSHPDTSPSSEPSNLQVSPSMWTSITSDTTLINKLIELYFCWEYPNFASLSAEQFLDDYRQGRAKYCSPMLVNALLSLGCRFSSQPASLSDSFFRESLRLFGEEADHHCLTSIQTLGILSLREAGVGHDSDSFYYAGQSIRLAVELGLHDANTNSEGFDDDEITVRAATFWGAFALDHCWSLATGSLPICSHVLRLPIKPPIISELEAATWVPVTDDGEGMSRGRLLLANYEEASLSVEAEVSSARRPHSAKQPSNVRSVYNCFCELSEVVHDSLYVLHSPGLTGNSLLRVYTASLDWYSRIPDVLKLGQNYTPSVLFVHMYYHYFVLLLLRSFVKLRILGSSVQPRQVCLQASGAILSLLRSYSQIYSLRRTPSFVPYFVLSALIVHLTIAPSPPPTSPSQPSTEESTPSDSDLQPHASEAITRGIGQLTEMSAHHGFAAQALHILKWHAKKLRVNVDIKTNDDETMATWGTAASSAANSSRLSWPFPMQGGPGPMLPLQPAALREAGFELLP